MTSELDVTCWEDRSEPPAVFWVSVGACGAMAAYAADAYNARCPEALGDVLRAAGSALTAETMAVEQGMDPADVRAWASLYDGTLERQTGFSEVETANGEVLYAPEDIVAETRVSAWDEAVGDLDPRVVSAVEAEVREELGLGPDDAGERADGMEGLDEHQEPEDVTR